MTIEVIIVLVEYGGQWFKPGVYLKWFDHTANDGYGEMYLTKDRKEAKRFPSRGEAFEFWNYVPPNHPIRVMDGKPNKPLTAYTVSFEPYDLQALANPSG